MKIKAHRVFRIPFTQRYTEDHYDIIQHARFSGITRLVVAFGWRIADRACGVSKLSWCPHVLWTREMVKGTESEPRYL